MSDGPPKLVPRPRFGGATIKQSRLGGLHQEQLDIYEQ